MRVPFLQDSTFTGLISTRNYKTSQEWSQAYSLIQTNSALWSSDTKSLWGSISGTLSAQSDLWSYLSAETFSPSQLTAFLATNSITLCSIDVRGQILSAGSNLFNIFLTNRNAANSYLPLSGGTITGPLYVLSSLYVAGSAFYVQAQDLIVSDPIIYIAEGNQTDLLDIGIIASWTNTPGYPTGYQHGGLIRRADNKAWTLFSGATSEPLSGLNVEWSQLGIQLEPLSAKFYGDIYGNRNVYGSLSSTNVVYAQGGNSNLWNEAYKLAVNTLPVPKIIFSKSGTVIPHLSGIGESMVNAGNFSLLQYPRVVTQGLTQDLLDNYSIFVEMVIFKGKNKSYGNTTSGYTTPNPYPDVKPWGNYFWTRSGGNTLAESISRYNQLPVTSINEVIDLSPCFHNHFRSVDVSYLDSTSVNDQDFKFLNCIVPINSKHAKIDFRITRLGYDRIYKSMYVAFRYIAWLPEANGGRGQIVEGPLSPTVRVANTRWPFNTDHFNSSLKGFAVVTPNGAFIRDNFSCTFV